MSDFWWWFWGGMTFLGGAFLILTAISIIGWLLVGMFRGFWLLFDKFEDWMREWWGDGS